MSRDTFAEKMSAIQPCSGRSLDRYRQLLNLSAPIQRAIEAKRLRAEDGYKILGLPPQDQEHIASACDSGLTKAALRQLVRKETPNKAVKQGNRSSPVF